MTPSDMHVHLSFNRWQEPTRWLDTHELAMKTVEEWVKASPDGSPDSLVTAFEHTLNGVLKALCDA